MNKDQHSNIILQSLSPHLFWDTTKESLDIETDKTFIIQRVLEYGKLHDWVLLRKIYSLKEIAHTSKQLPILDKKALSFISTISSTPIEQFKCYNTTPSQQAHWNF